jgi:hypothetical protein
MVGDRSEVRALHGLIPDFVGRRADRKQVEFEYIAEVRP